MTLYLHTTLQRETPTGMQRRMELTIPAASRVADLLKAAGVQEVGEAVLLVVNGRTATSKHSLSDGDEVHLIPAISGGSEDASAEPKEAIRLISTSSTTPDLTCCSSPIK